MSASGLLAIFASVAAPCWAIETSSLLQVGNLGNNLGAHEDMKPIAEDDLPEYNETTDQILVFSEQKTGSTTLQSTLGQLTPQHAHLPVIGRDMLMDVYPPNIKTHHGIIAHDFLQKVPRGKNVWIFKSVRNTYARVISDFFQHLCTAQKACREELAILDDSTMQDLYGRFDSWMKSDFMSLLRNGSKLEANPSVFMDVTGVDLFQTKFKGGRLVLEQDRGTDKLYVVVLRLEEVDQWETVLKPMFPEYKAVSTNPGEEKWYGAAYEKFKASYKFSNEDVSELRKADLDSGFYTKSEWEGFEASAKGVDQL